MASNVSGIKAHLFSQSRPPSDENLEVPLPEDLQILTVCENVWCCKIEVTPSEAYQWCKLRVERVVNILLLLACFKRNFVYTSKEGNRVCSLDKLGSRTLFE